MKKFASILIFTVSLFLGFLPQDLSALTPSTPGEYINHFVTKERDRQDALHEALQKFKKDEIELESANPR